MDYQLSDITYSGADTALNYTGETAEVVNSASPGGMEAETLIARAGATT
ncbi:MAG: hypothetical protein ABEJ62_02490 [Candidatus Nanohaloarchaea archaeon]